MSDRSSETVVAHLHHSATPVSETFRLGKNRSNGQPSLRSRPHTWKAVRSVLQRSYRSEKPFQAAKNETGWYEPRIPTLQPRQHQKQLEQTQASLVEEDSEKRPCIPDDKQAEIYKDYAGDSRLCTTVVSGGNFDPPYTIYDDAKLSYGICLWLTSPRTGQVTESRRRASKSEEEALKTLRWLLIEDDSSLGDTTYRPIPSHYAYHPNRHDTFGSPPPYSQSLQTASTLVPSTRDATKLKPLLLEQSKTCSDHTQSATEALHPHRIGIESRTLPEEAPLVSALEPAADTSSFLDDVSSFKSDGERFFVDSDRLENNDDESIVFCEPRSLHSRDLAIDNLVRDFSHLLRSHAAGSSSNGSSNGSAASTRSSKTESLTSANTSLTGKSAAKRHRGNSRDRDGFEEDDRQSKRTKASSTAQHPPSLFACPYSKRDPVRYSAQNVHEVNYRHCASTFSTSIPRLKQHLYRVHKRPDHYCSCCYADFKTRDCLEKHMRQRSCHNALSPFEDKMTHDQMVSIKRRDVGRDPQTVWYNIYAVLFPGYQLPDSPYVDNQSQDTSQDVVDFLQDRAPTMLSTIIGAEADAALGLTRTQRDVLDGIIEGSMSRWFQQLGQQLRMPSQTTTVLPQSTSGIEPPQQPNDRHRQSSLVTANDLSSHAQQSPSPAQGYEPQHPSTTLLPYGQSTSIRSVYNAPQATIPTPAWRDQQTDPTRPMPTFHPDPSHTGLPLPSFAGLSASPIGQVQLGHTFTCENEEDFEWEDFLLKGFNH